MTRIAILVSAEGAASPRDITAALPAGTDPLWVLRSDDDVVARLRPILERSGIVVAFAGDAMATAGEMRRRAADIVGITTFDDTMLIPAARLAAALELPYHSVECASTLRDKAAQRLRLAERDADTVRFVSLRSADDLPAAFAHIGSPAVLKPRRGVGSRFTFRLDRGVSTGAFAALIPTQVWDEGMILEEELIGVGHDPTTGLADYLSVETISVRGEHRVIAEVGRLELVPPFRERGGVFPAGLSPDAVQSAHQLAIRALIALGVENGVCHVEVKLTATGPRLIEVNGRLGGHVSWLLRRTGGPDLVAAQLCIAVARRWRSLPWQSAGIAFRHLVPAPSTVGVTDEVNGVAAARVIPGVETVRVLVRTGEVCDWRRGTMSAIAEISGWVESYEALHRCVAEVERGLTVAFRPH